MTSPCFIVAMRDVIDSKKKKFVEERDESHQLSALIATCSPALGVGRPGPKLCRGRRSHEAPVG